MRNTQEIIEYLDIGQNRTFWEGKTLDKALEIEKQYEKEIKEGTIGYSLICDFDCSPFILEDEDKNEMIEIERFEEAGIVVYKIKNKEFKIYCKHCGDLLVEGENHSEDSYENDICNDCMNEYYGYCDECNKLFLYYDKMNEHFHPTGSVLCPECRHKFQAPLIKNRSLPLQFQPYAKTVSLHYPDNVKDPNLLQYCGTHWENLLINFFEKQKCVINTDTNNGMTSQAIEISFKYETSDKMIEEICNQAIKLVLQASRPKFKVGSAATFTTTQSDLIQYDGQGVTIQRILSEDECDIDEVGFMYEVMNFNGNKFQAFEEELF